MEMHPAILKMPREDASDWETPGPRRSRRDRGALSPARQRLATRFVALARSLSKSYRKRWPGHAEDFDGAAMLALVEAAESYEQGHGVRFSTFARYRISGAMRSLQRSIVASRKPVGSDGPAILPGDFGPEAEGGGRLVGISSEPPIGWREEIHDVVERWLRGLPERYAVACRHIYVLGRSQAETARVLGMSQSRLCFIHRQAIDMLCDAWKPRHYGSDGAAA